MELFGNFMVGYFLPCIIGIILFILSVMAIIAMCLPIYYLFKDVHEKINKKASFRILEVTHKFAGKTFIRYYVEKKFLLFFYKKVTNVATIVPITNDENKNEKFSYFTLKDNKNRDYFKTYSEANEFIENFLAKPKTIIHEIK